MRKAQKDLWEVYVSTLIARVPMKKIAGKFSSTAAPVLRVNGTVVAAPKEVANPPTLTFVVVSSCEKTSATCWSPGQDGGTASRLL